MITKKTVFVLGAGASFDFGFPLVDGWIKNVGETLLSFFSRQQKNLQIKFNKSFLSYLKKSCKKYSKTKTILYKDTPVPLSESININYEHFISNNLFTQVSMFPAGLCLF